MTHMQLNSDVLNRINYLVGTSEIVNSISDISSKQLFDNSIIEFLNYTSKEIMKDSRSRMYSDVVTFAFWIRKSSIVKLNGKYNDEMQIKLGKGVAFHIAPSNVPVNFAYSLVSGLLTGNVNIVRVPSKEFPQVGIITDALNKALIEYPEMRQYVLCIRYDRDKDINDLLSSLADVRIVWGGDQTISELRKSPLQPRAGEITFADRYSLAVIDSDRYMDIEDKERVAEDFYNDTFLTDQNACTSPRIVVWTGSQKQEAKKVFWDNEYRLVKKKYTFQSIQGVNKLTKAFLAAAEQFGVKILERKDNLIVRVAVLNVTEKLMEYRDNSGYFYEYDCDDIMSIAPLCKDNRCQTLGYIGDKEMFLPLLISGVKGIDRVVPIGKTMDFDLIWDGYNLPALLTRTIVME